MKSGSVPSNSLFQIILIEERVLLYQYIRAKLIVIRVVINHADYPVYNLMSCNICKITKLKNIMFPCQNVLLDHLVVKITKMMNAIL